MAGINEGNDNLMNQIRVRLKDIAEATGFSTNTVSLALRGSPLVTEPTRLTIVKAAEELKYRPNEIAKSLVRRQTDSIGLVLTNIVNPILTKTAQAVERALTSHGYTTLFATSSNSLELEKKAIDVFCARQVDGILIYPTDHGKIEHIRTLRDYHIPVVLLAVDPRQGIDAISLDESCGAYRATRHLLELGHRRIAFLDGASAPGNLEKLQGYQRALKEKNIAPNEMLISKQAGFAPPQGYVGMQALMQAHERLTAVFCATDSLAFGVMHWCREHGLGVPEDISVIGFDNIEFSAYASTPLTTVGYEAEQLAHMAVERLLLIINASGGMPKPKVEVIEPKVLIRQSTGPIALNASNAPRANHPRGIK